MKPSALIPAGALCVLLGWFLPPLWSGKENPAPRRLVLRPAPAGAIANFTTGVRGTCFAMAQFQAVVAGVTGHERSLVNGPNTLDGFPSDEAAELAARLAGEELGRSVTDGAAFLRSLKGVDDELRSAVLEAWADHDPDAALRALIAPPDADISEDDSAGDDDVLIRRLVERDPDKALALLKSAGPASTILGWSAVTGALAKKDPALAMEVLRSAPVQARGGGLEAIRFQLAKKDPRAALEWVKTLSPDWRNLISLSATYEQWADTDPLAAIAAWKESAHTDSSNPFDVRSLTEFADKWARKDPEGAIRWGSENAVADPSHTFVRSGIAELAAQDPRRAAAVLEVIPEFSRQTAISTLVKTWAAADFQAALAWSRTLPSADRQEAYTSLGPSAAQLNPQERLDLAREMGIETRAGFGILWSSDHTEAASRFAAMSPDSQREVVAGWSTASLLESPAEAMKMMRVALGNDDPPGHLKEDVLPILISDWARLDPVAAAAGVKELPPGDSQVLAVNNLINAWSPHDSAGAAAWTLALPGGPAKDKAFQQLADTAAASGDPAAAWKWSASVQNSDERESALGNHFTEWVKTDPAAAKAALEALPPDAADKERVLHFHPEFFSGSFYGPPPPPPGDSAETP